MARGRELALGPQMPVVEALRMVLEQRIGTVRRYARRVAERPGEDPEDVHQLRVATRRLSAALGVFKPLIERDSARRINRAARRLRRAAGPMRDLDVLHAAIVELIPPTAGDTGARRVLLKRLDKRRRRAAEELGSAIDGARSRFRRAADRFGRKVSRSVGLPVPDESRLCDYSEQVMRRRWDGFLVAARGELTDADELHVLRIVAKRLRYALEVFACCFPPDLAREWYAFVEEVQSQLGALNDLRNLADLLDEWQQRESFKDEKHVDPTARLTATLRKQARQEWRDARRRFLEVWCSAECQSLRDRLAAMFDGGGTSPTDAPQERPRSPAEIVDTREQDMVNTGSRPAGDE